MIYLNLQVTRNIKIFILGGDWNINLLKLDHSHVLDFTALHNEAHKNS